ncbi:MAG: hypothetical protein ACFFEV_07605 [Candidatus Thorarchaeota archaeon]
MVASGSKHVLIESLTAMKKSFESAYDFKTRVEEETLLLKGLGERYRGFRVFSDYRRNEGRRRFNELSELLTSALNKIGNCDSKTASSVYLDTLKGVLLQTRWMQILELYSNRDRKKK